MTRRLPLFACLALLAAGPATAGSWLEEAGAESTAPSASERHGIRPGSHEIQIFGGGFRGDLAYSNDRIAPPLNAEPVRLRIELEGSGSFGIGYWYQAHERWAVGAQITSTSAKLQHETPFDRAAEEEALFSHTVVQVNQGSELTDQQKTDLLDRIEARSRPRDADLTLIDIGAVYIIHPQGPWMGEVGGGLGWSSSSFGEEPMIWEQLFRNDCDPSDSSCQITVANELVNPATAGRCPADDDPCVELRSKSALSWHGQAALRYAFTDAVQLRLGVKIRVLESVSDPGDTTVTSEGTLGFAFRFGGD